MNLKYISLNFAKSDILDFSRNMISWSAFVKHKVNIDEMNFCERGNLIENKGFDKLGPGSMLGRVSQLCN